MKKDKWLLRAVFAEALKMEDIAFLRNLFETEKSDKKIRLRMVEKMIGNSESMRMYIREEKITDIMATLGGKLHWYLVFSVNRRKLDEKKAVVGWNDRCQEIIEKKAGELKERMFDRFGKWRFNGGDEESVEEAMNILEQAATEALEEIESAEKNEPAEVV